MKKFFLVFAILFLTKAFAQNKKSAEIIKNESLKQETILDSIDYIKRNIQIADTQADTRSLLYFLGTLQEQLGLYTDASSSYAKAAGIAAKDATNMPKVSAEQLVLDAVRTSLCAGNWETANSYLNSAIQSSKDENVKATTKLYAVWSDLCKASSVPDADISDSIELLKAYSSMQSMKSVKPQILLTLYHLTDSTIYSDILKKEYPNSPEASIVNGNAEIMRAPFWYFVPKANAKKQNVDTNTKEDIPQTTIQKDFLAVNAKEIDNTEIAIEQKHSGKKQQLGLFKQKENADECVRKVREKGFNAYCYTEKRASGTTYFIVAVDEDSTLSMGKKLKEAGFDCYTTE